MALAVPAPGQDRLDQLLLAHHLKLFHVAVQGEKDAVRYGFREIGEQATAVQAFPMRPLGAGDEYVGPPAGHDLGAQPLEGGLPLVGAFRIAGDDLHLDLAELPALKPGLDSYSLRKTRCGLLLETAAQLHIILKSNVKTNSQFAGVFGVAGNEKQAEQDAHGEEKYRITNFAFHGFSP